MSKLIVVLIALTATMVLAQDNSTTPTPTTAPATPSAGPTMVSPVIDNNWSGFDPSAASTVASYPSTTSHVVFHHRCHHHSCPSSDPCEHPECDPVTPDEVADSKRKDKRALKEEKKVEQWIESLQKRLNKAESSLKAKKYTQARRLARRVQKSLEKLESRIAKYQHRNALRSQMGRNVEFVSRKLNTDAEKLQALSSQAQNILDDVQKETGYEGTPACAHPACPAATPVCPHVDCPASHIQTLCYHPQCPASIPYCPHPDCHTRAKLLKKIARAYKNLKKRYKAASKKSRAAWVALAKSPKYSKKAVLKERKVQLHRFNKLKKKISRVLGKVKSLEDSLNGAANDKILTLREKLVALLKKVKAKLRRLLKIRGGQSTRLALVKLLLKDAKARLAKAQKKQATQNKQIGTKDAAKVAAAVANTTKSIASASKEIQEVKNLIKSTTSNSTTPAQLAALKNDAKQVGAGLVAAANTAGSLQTAAQTGTPVAGLPSAPAASVAKAVAKAATKAASKASRLDGEIAKRKLLKQRVDKLTLDVKAIQAAVAALQTKPASVFGK